MVTHAFPARWDIMVSGIDSIIAIPARLAGSSETSLDDTMVVAEEMELDGVSNISVCGVRFEDKSTFANVDLMDGSLSTEGESESYGR